jgi:hypothetical protein
MVLLMLRLELDLSDDVARFKKLGELGAWGATCTMFFLELRVWITTCSYFAYLLNK